MKQAETLLGFSTPELARHLGITAEGMRVHLCKRGSYYGLKPERLPNGRLIWPADSMERLKEAGRKTRVHTPDRKAAAAKMTGRNVAGVEYQQARG
jgi:hypothetical protein